MLRLMGSVWGRKRAACQLTRLSSLKKCHWRRAQSASQAEILDVIFVRLHLDFKVLVLTVDVLFFTFPEWDVLEWGTVKTACSSGHRVALFLMSHYPTLIHGCESSNRSHCCVCVCAELLCSMTNERGLWVIVEILLLCRFYGSGWMRPPEGEGTARCTWLNSDEKWR